MSRQPWRTDPDARLARDAELVLDFCLCCRARRADVRDAARAVMQSRDTDALRLLLRAVDQGGSQTVWVLRAVRRLARALAENPNHVRECLAA